MKTATLYLITVVCSHPWYKKNYVISYQYINTSTLYRLKKLRRKPLRIFHRLLLLPGSISAPLQIFKLFWPLINFILSYKRCRCVGYKEITTWHVIHLL